MFDRKLIDSFVQPHHRECIHLAVIEKLPACKLDRRARYFTSRHASKSGHGRVSIRHIEPRIRQARNQRGEHFLNREATLKVWMVNVGFDNRKKVLDVCRESAVVGLLNRETPSRRALMRVSSKLLYTMNRSAVAQLLNQDFGKLPFAVLGGIGQIFAVARFGIDAIAMVDAELSEGLAGGNRARRRPGELSQPSQSPNSDKAIRWMQGPQRGRSRLPCCPIGQNLSHAPGAR